MKMAAKYRIIPTHRLKLVEISGKTDYKELENLFYEYIRDPDFEPSLRILADLRGMTDAITGLMEIRKLKLLYQYAYRDTVGVVDVVIVPKAGVANRAARAFALFMRDKRPLKIQITSSWAEAHKMLGVGVDVTNDLSENRETAQILAWNAQR